MPLGSVSRGKLKSKSGFAGIKLATNLDVAIVGAGPYGLSIAAHLKALGVRNRVFGEPMQTWRNHMPRGMGLKSDPFASCLYDPASRFTLEAFCRERGLPYAPTGWRVPLETFIEYGCWFQTQAVPNLDRSKVQQVEPDGHAFQLSVEGGEKVRAKRVVVCAGISHFAHLPPEFRGIPSHLVSHSSEHADPATFAGRDVTVLGGGASALDLAMLMREAGVAARLVARAPALKFGSGGPGRPFASGPDPQTHIRARRRMVDLHPDPLSEAPSVSCLMNLGPEWLRRVLGPAAGWGVRERPPKGKILLRAQHRDITHIETLGDRLSLQLAGGEGPPRDRYRTPGRRYRLSRRRHQTCFLDARTSNDASRCWKARRV